MGWAKRLGAFTSGFAQGFVPLYSQRKLDENRIREEAIRQMDREQREKEEGDRLFNRDTAFKTGTLGQLGPDYGVSAGVATAVDTRVQEQNTQAQKIQELEQEKLRMETANVELKNKAYEKEQQDATTLQTANAYAVNVDQAMVKGDMKGAQKNLDILAGIASSSSVAVPIYERTYDDFYRATAQQQEERKAENKATKEADEENRFVAYENRVDALFAQAGDDPVEQGRMALVALALAEGTGDLKGYNLRNTKVWRESGYRDKLTELAKAGMDPERTYNPVSDPRQAWARYRADSTAAAPGKPGAAYRVYGPAPPPGYPAAPGASLPASGNGQGLVSIPALADTTSFPPTRGQGISRGIPSIVENTTGLDPEEIQYIRAQADSARIDFNEARRLLEQKARGMGAPVR